MDANLDFKDLFQSLSDARVRFLVVGAYAVIYHAEPRYTKDIDIWSDPSPENARKLWQALSSYGAPLSGMSVADFTNENYIFQMGVAPNRIDILMGVEGLEFGTAWQNRVAGTYAGVTIQILGKEDLIRAKKAAGRARDLLDVRDLEKRDRTAPAAKRKRKGGRR